MGVKLADEPSGPLTFNLGLVSVDQDQCSLTVDIRYPATLDGTEISATLQQQVEGCGLTYTLALQLGAPVPAQGEPAGHLLSGAYKDITGEECQVFSHGRRHLCPHHAGPGVAFGPGFRTRRTAMPTT